MTPLQSTLALLLVSVVVGFLLASVLLPGTALTRLGGLCFWLARLLVASSVAALALGVLEIANSDLLSDTEFGTDDGNRALLARLVTDLLYAGTLAGWGVVVQVIGMSSFASRERADLDPDPDR
jgi:hypothetical protein